MCLRSKWCEQKVGFLILNPDKNAEKNYELSLKFRSVEMFGFNNLKKESFKY